MRTAKADNGRLQAVAEAREAERLARADARKKLEDMIDREVEAYHQQVVSTVRLALLDGYSARQIGKAYGSSDANTIKRIINEANEGSVAVVETKKPFTIMDIDPVSDEFTIEANGVGEDKFVGKARFSIDSDNNNITVIDGDVALQAVLYRAGLVPSIIRYVRLS